MLNLVSEYSVFIVVYCTQVCVVIRDTSRECWIRNWSRDAALARASPQQEQQEQQQDE